MTRTYSERRYPSIWPLAVSTYTAAVSGSATRRSALLAVVPFGIGYWCTGCPSERFSTASARDEAAAGVCTSIQILSPTTTGAPRRPLNCLDCCHRVAPEGDLVSAARAIR